MTAAYDAAALGLTVAGLVCLALAWLLARQWRAGLGMALELWMAAGLLRLARPGEWEAIALAAAVVVLRRVLVAAVAVSAR